MDQQTKHIIIKLKKLRHTFYPMYYLTKDEINHLVMVLENGEMYRAQSKYYAKILKGGN